MRQPIKLSVTLLESTYREAIEHCQWTLALALGKMLHDIPVNRTEYNLVMQTIEDKVKENA